MNIHYITQVSPRFMEGSRGCRGAAMSLDGQITADQVTKMMDHLHVTRMFAYLNITDGGQYTTT